MSETPVEKPYSRVLASFRYRDYRFYWLSSFLEHIGEWAERVAIDWLIYQLTNAPLALGLLQIVRGTPSLGLSLVGGVMADRVDRRKVIIATLVAMVLLSLGLFVLVRTDWVQWWHLIVAAGLGGSLLCFNHPARFSLLPNIVRPKDLLNAVALERVSVGGVRVLIAPLAGIAIGAAGAAQVFGVRAVFAVAAIVCILLLARTFKSQVRHPQPVLRQFVQGLRYLRGQRTVALLLGVGLGMEFYSPVTTVLLPVFARDILKAGAPGLGYLTGAAGLGGLIGMTLMASLANPKRRGLILLGTGLVLGATQVAFSQSPWLLLSLALMVVIGISHQVMETMNFTLLQLNVTDEMRGRVMSFIQLFRGFAPLVALAISALAQFLGAPFALAVTGSLAMASFLIMLLVFTPVRRLA